MDLKFHAYIIFMDSSLTWIKRRKWWTTYSIWTCILSIGCTARLNLLDNNLFTVESLIWKFSCLHAFSRKRACFKLQSHVVKFLIVLKMCGCATNLQVWFPGCPLFSGNFVSKSPVGSSNLVRCPESRSIRLSEVAYALVLQQFQSVTQCLSAVERLSTSRRVCYGRFDCILNFNLSGQ